MSEFREPIDMIAGDQPNTCPFDGSRTESLEQREDYTVERCLHCNRLFNFWQDNDA
jgi:hypothetical protein